MNFAEWKNMKPLSPPAVCTHEQFLKIVKPVVCNVCRRIFNPTDEEREKDRLALEEIDKSIFEWEVILNYETN